MTDPTLQQDYFYCRQVMRSTSKNYGSGKIEVIYGTVST